MNGKTVGIVLREAKPEDEGAGIRIFKHPALRGGGLALLRAMWMDGGTCSGEARWGELLGEPYWKDLEGRLGMAVEVAARKQQQPQQLRSGAPAEKSISVIHHGPVMELSMSSDAVKGLRYGSCLIFQVFPSKVTAAAFVGSEGLVLMDDLGGNRGLKYLSLGPVGPGVLVPRDPRVFVVNLGRTAVNPLRQAKVCEAVLKDAARSLPGGKEVASAAKPLREAIQRLGDTRIAGTTPNHAIQSWQEDPAKAAEKTVKSVENTQILGTTPAHAVDSWTSNPGNAAVKTVKSLKFW
jgi:hypothetical protein